jgi:hypothetical protein
MFQGTFDACFRAPKAGVAVASRQLLEVGLVLRGAEVVVAGDARQDLDGIVAQLILSTRCLMKCPS